MNTRKNGRQATAAKTRRPGFSTRLLLNLLVAGMGVLLFSKVIGNNDAYSWMWNTFAPVNLESIKTDKSLSPEQRLARKLGVDFNYVMMIRDYTPTDAVVFYPGKGDFMATPEYGNKLQFRGTLVDKMSAIRFLYPRKVVIREELGKTPYAKRITHVGIVNGRNAEMLHYPVDSTTMHTILPVVPQK